VLWCFALHSHRLFLAPDLEIDTESRISRRAADLAGVFREAWSFKEQARACQTVHASVRKARALARAQLDIATDRARVARRDPVTPALEVNIALTPKPYYPQLSTLNPQPSTLNLQPYARAPASQRYLSRLATGTYPRPRPHSHSHRRRTPSRPGCPVRRKVLRLRTPQASLMTLGALSAQILTETDPCRDAKAIVDRPTVR